MKKRVLMIITALLLVITLASCSGSSITNKEHKITVSDTSNGTIVVSKTVAKKDEEITVSFLPNEGYSVVESSKVFNYINFLTDDKFIMPDKDVLVSARFEKSNYDIRVNNDSSYGSISSVTKAAPGSSVEVNITVESNYTVEYVKYNSTKINKNNGKYTFIMPKANVVISASYVLSEDLPLSNVKYGSNDNELDIYVPEDKTTSPTSMMVYLHSGFWMAGTRDEFKDYYQELSDNANIAVVSVDYSLIDPTDTLDDTNFLKMIDDITKSISFSKERLATWDIKVDKMAISGYSAGAHLAMLYAYKYSADSAVPIKFLNTYCAPSDFSVYNSIGESDEGFKAWLQSDNLVELYTSAAGSSSTTKINFGGITIDPENPTTLSLGRNYMLSLFGKLVGSSFTSDGFLESQSNLINIDLPKYSPIEFISEDSIPSLLIYGENDGLVQLEQGTNVDAKLTENGVTHDFIVLENTNHNFMNTVLNNTVEAEKIKTALYSYIDLYL